MTLILLLSCIPPDLSVLEGWYVEEQHLSGINISNLVDNDNTTCVDLTSRTSVITFGQKVRFLEEFKLEVLLPRHLESYRSEIVRVLTSGYNTESTSHCPQTVTYKKCLYIGEYRYSCICQNSCQLSVKITFVSDSVKARRPLEVCEIKYIF